MLLPERWRKVIAICLTGLINLLIPISMAKDTNCNENWDIEAGESRDILNPDYPNKYPSGTTCKWVIQSPENTQIRLKCTVVDIPVSDDCEEDAVVVSRIGNPDLQDSQSYCGNMLINVFHQSNKLTVDLLSSESSSGGTLSCTVTSVEPEASSLTTRSLSPPDCDCGLRQMKQRIVGGEETEVNEFPFMAALINLVENAQQCGATIISDRYALTAAHCVDHYGTDELALLVGDHDITTDTDTASAELYSLEHFEVHPDWNGGRRRNDIAVVRTVHAITFSSDVGPVCLPFKFTDVNFTGVMSTALGWGYLMEGGPKSDTLQKVNLSIIANVWCQDALSSASIYDTQICTFHPSKDSCQFDSGGPILWYDEASERLQEIGIVSYGAPCAQGHPAVNTRVTSFLDWIVSVTSDAEYCIP